MGKVVEVTQKGAAEPGNGHPLSQRPEPGEKCALEERRGLTAPHAALSEVFNLKPSGSAPGETKCTKSQTTPRESSFQHLIQIYTSEARPQPHETGRCSGPSENTPLLREFSKCWLCT